MLSQGSAPSKPWQSNCLIPVVGLQQESLLVISRPLLSIDVRFLGPKISCLSGVEGFLISLGSAVSNCVWGYSDSYHIPGDRFRCYSFLICNRILSELWR